MLWERYRSLAYTLIAAVVLALGGSSLYRYWQQSEVDKVWSTFATTLGLDDSYTDIEAWSNSLSKRLITIESAQLQTALTNATEVQKPFVLLAIARKAIEVWRPRVRGPVDAEIAIAKVISNDEDDVGPRGRRLRFARFRQSRQNETEHQQRRRTPG